MARVNISVPDSLYERLDRLRERVNISKVCTAALEKEVAMLEVRPAGPDPELESLIRRLKPVADRWYQRGREDGRRWAIDTATRAELRHYDDRGFERMTVEHLPSSFPLEACLTRWLGEGAGEDAGADAPPDEPLDATAVQADGEPIQRLRKDIDEPAYLRGWWHAVRETWKAVEPALT
jgi:hypothetical protein